MQCALQQLEVVSHGVRIAGVRVGVARLYVRMLLALEGVISELEIEMTRCETEASSRRSQVKVSDGAMLYGFASRLPQGVAMSQS